MERGAGPRAEWGGRCGGGVGRSGGVHTVRAHEPPSLDLLIPPSPVRDSTSGEKGVEES